MAYLAKVITWQRSHANPGNDNIPVLALIPIGRDDSFLGLIGYSAWREFSRRAIEKNSSVIFIITQPVTLFKKKKQQQ